jgi:hypothetical protein
LSDKPFQVFWSWRDGQDLELDEGGHLVLVRPGEAAWTRRQGSDQVLVKQLRSGLPDISWAWSKVIYVAEKSEDSFNGLVASFCLNKIIKIFWGFQKDADKVGKYLKAKGIEGWISRVIKTVKTFSSFYCDKNIKDSFS